MPMWNIFHPSGAYSAEEKQIFSERITALYTQIPLPKFYVTVVFQEIEKDSMFVGAIPRDNFVRIRIDQIARTLPTARLREWWVRTIDECIAPFVKERGYDWEFHVDETPLDLWGVQGEIPPPFESVAEKRWIRDNKASPYTLGETIGPLAAGRSVNNS